MSSKEIQIVTFENPFPANYGGVIDVFYKVKALHSIGVAVILHVFYLERENIEGIEPYCKTIFLYKRRKGLSKVLLSLPYAVATRNSLVLARNLKASKAPIFFESLRTTLALNTNTFKQTVAVRCHNIEHDYSWGLSKNETNPFKKWMFWIEGCKFKRYEKVLNKANVLFSISNYETSYFKKKYTPTTYFLPVCHGNEKITSKKGFGTYALYHGDLSVSDNLKSAFFIIDVFEQINKPLIIASSTRVPKLLSRIYSLNNVSFRDISKAADLNDLIRNAHINTLFSFQRSGTKLKVFNALYNGRHCIVNENMVDDLEILSLCTVAVNKEIYKKSVLELFDKKFIVPQKRIEILKKYDDVHNAKKIVDIML